MWMMVMVAVGVGGGDFWRRGSRGGIGVKGILMQDRDCCRMELRVLFTRPSLYWKKRMAGQLLGKITSLEVNSFE